MKDTIAKIIVIILFIAFLGLAAYNMIGPKNAPAGSGDSAGQTAAAQRAPGQGPENTAGGAPAVGGTGRGEAQSGAGGAAERAAGAGALGQGAGQAGARPPAQNAITVTAKTMQNETIRQTVKLNGDVSSQSEVNIYPDTGGKITRIVKELGDSVREGDVIAYIDPSRPGAAFVQSPVLATVAGTITSLPVNTGETVSAQTSIAVVGSLNDLKIVVYVAEKYSAYLKRGLPAFVSFASAPGESFEAAVIAVSPIVNNKNRTIETTLSLSKKDDRIKQGMFATVNLVIREEKNTMVLPGSALKNYNGDPVVYLIDADDIARRIPVTTGLSNDTEVQILTGIQAGDRVITAGAVTDGSGVRIAETTQR
jgi:multidrug efflux pump subunit AcrA (membrane-fusion protein)